MTRPLVDADREAIATWRYTDALAIYDPGQAASELREPDHFALVREDGELIGYGTLGEEARVPGGQYGSGASIVDVGLGLRPDLVGSGLGASALDAVIEHARRVRLAGRVRATVAEANGRASALVTNAGFRPTFRFQRQSDGRHFAQFERAAGA